MNRFDNRCDPSPVYLLGKFSLESGFDGAVAFYAKTNLIQHFSLTLGATLFKNQKMLIFKIPAAILINKYFKDEKK